MGEARRSQILRCQAGIASDASEHAGADLVAVVKGEGDVRPTGTLKDAVGTALPRYLPTDP